jgi:hypothetical protein
MMDKRYSKGQSNHDQQACAKARLVSGDSRPPATSGRFSSATPVALLTRSTLGFGLAAIVAASLQFSGLAFAQVQPASVRNASRDSGVHAADSIEQALTARGLSGPNLWTSAGALKPPIGTEVDETVQKAKQDGKTISRTRSWTEDLSSSNVLHVELTSFPSKQSQVAFWVLPRDSRGCATFGRTMYDTNGHPLKSEFWRNDRELRITGAADFPPDLYPEAVPAVALLRAVDFMHQGGSGKIDQQVSPYGFVDLQLNVQNANQVEVPAGRFAAVRVDSQPNMSTILPSWPRFTLGMMSRFLPQTTYYFEAQPPHRLLRLEQAGTPFIGGPEATTELVRYYVAGTTASRASSVAVGQIVTQ